MVTLYTLPAHLKRGPHERNIGNAGAHGALHNHIQGLTHEESENTSSIQGMTGGADSSGQHLRLGTSKAQKLRKQGCFLATWPGCPIYPLQSSYYPYRAWQMGAERMGAWKWFELQFSFTQAYTNTKTNASQKIQTIPLH